MKEFINALKCTMICQLLCWGIFILFDEYKYVSQSTAETLAFNSGFIVLIILLVTYFVYINKYIKNKNMNSIKFNIFLFTLWSVTSILITCGLLVLVDKKILHICQKSGWSCFLNGLEYAIEGFLMIALVVLILIIKIIIVVYNYFKKKKNQ